MTAIPSDFGYTDEHDLLRQSARRFLAERCPLTEVRRLADDATGYDPAVWRAIAELGWIGLTLPEELGGAGLDHLHMALLLDEMGRCLLPSPFVASTLALAALELAGGDAARDRCEPIANGEAIATVALDEPGGFLDAEHTTAVAERRDGGWTLTGHKRNAMWAQAAQLVIAPFRLGANGPLGLFAVDLPAAGVTVEPEVGVDPTRRTARIAFDGAHVGERALLAETAAPVIDGVFVRGCAMLAAEMVGGTEAVLGITRNYANERLQFNRPIGAFQAVKHTIVNMMLDVELGRSLALAAAAALTTDPSTAERSARMAKAHASEMFPHAAGRGIQLHGGFGFTWDCDIHFYAKRAMWSRAAFGDGLHHRRALAASLFDDGIDELADVEDVGLSMTL